MKRKITEITVSENDFPTNIVIQDPKTLRPIMVWDADVMDDHVIIYDEEAVTKNGIKTMQYKFKFGQKLKVLGEF